MAALEEPPNGRHVTTQPTIAVLGTGIMGAPIARNLQKAGFNVRAWNRSHDKATALESDGITVADTPADAAKGADFVMTILIDGEAVEQTMVDGGALNAMSKDAIWLQCSTVGIEATERLADLAKTKRHQLHRRATHRHQEARRRRQAHHPRSGKPRPRTTMPTGLRCNRRTNDLARQRRRRVEAQARRQQLGPGRHRRHRRSDRARRRSRPRPATLPRHHQGIGDRQPVPPRQGRNDDQARLRSSLPNRWRLQGHRTDPRRRTKPQVSIKTS